MVPLEWRNESKSDIVTDINLDVVGDWLWGGLQKVGQPVRHSSLPLEVLGDQCQDLDKCPDTGQYLDVL